MSVVTGEVLANWLGISGTQVTSFARRGVMVRAGRKGFDLEASVRAYCQHMREAVAAQGRPAQSGTGKERATLAKAQADAIELKNARVRGTLVDSEAVAREWEGICRTIRAGMLRVPKRAAARLPHLTQQDVQTIDMEVRAALIELVDKIPK
jgi:phage terminase Nu1 subunit (DNA packaging protein)